MVASAISRHDAPLAEKFDYWLSRLRGVEKSGDGYKALCPAHDDGQSSLSTRIGDKSIVVTCHAGCRFPQICHAAGVTASWMFERQDSKSSRPKPAEKITGEWVYTDEIGTPLFRAIRIEDGSKSKSGKTAKDFRQHAADGNGGWKNSVKGVRVVPYKLSEIALSFGPVLIAEGERKCDRLSDLGYTATCNAAGAGKWKAEHSQCLAGRDVIILPDNDKAGRDHARKVEESLRGIAASVRVALLPGLPEKGDVVDFLNAGGTREKLQAALDSAVTIDKAFEAKPGGDGKLPTVLLPGDGVGISEPAATLGSLLAGSGAYFRRGMSVLILSRGDDDQPILRQCKPAMLSSEFEKFACLKCLKMTKEGPDEILSVCSEQNAKLILHSDAFLHSLPPIRLLSQSPVLVERNGELVQVTGYDRNSGVLAFGEKALDVSLPTAVDLLKKLLADFRFSTGSDLSRALAAIITPAVVHGGLLGGRSPIDLGEADQSQTGKGYKNKVTAAVYRQSVRTVTQRQGGVGSLEESMNTALIAGANFICLDNLRGKIDSPAIESLLTEDIYLARSPHSAAVEIDPRRVVMMMTSNRAQVTDDLANRASCVRLLKQVPGFQFQSFPEGDILGHVRANQTLYLGAVFAVVREWHHQGKPKSRETRHDFREWAQSLDWIVQNILNCPPLLDGHRETQQRISNPMLTWMRDVALCVIKAGKDGENLRTHELLGILMDAGDVEVPGLKDDLDLDDEKMRSSVLRTIGQKLSRCFNGKMFIDVDGFKIDRTETPDENYRKRFDYKFTRPPAFPRVSPASTPALNADTPAFPATTSISPVVCESSNTHRHAHTYTRTQLESNANDAGNAGVAGSTRGSAVSTLENVQQPATDTADTAHTATIDCPMCNYRPDNVGNDLCTEHRDDGKEF